jgi:hypothetical protein
MSSPDRNMKSLTYQSMLFPAPATNENGRVSLWKSHKELALTHVSHEPIEGNPAPQMLSILSTSRLQGTIPQTRGGVTCRQCCGSSLGRAATAIFEYPAPTCRLPDNLSDSGQ